VNRVSFKKYTFLFKKDIRTFNKGGWILG